MLCSFCAFFLYGYVKLAVLWFVFLFLAVVFRPRLSKNLSFLGDVIFPLTTGLFASYFSVLILFAEEVKSSPKISLFSYLDGFNRWGRVPDFCLVVCIYFLLRLFIKDRRLSAVISPLVLLLVGLIDGYVYLFRGSEATAADIPSIRTALNVASQYDFSVLLPIVSIVLPYICLVLAVYSFDFDDKKLSYQYRVNLSFPLVIALLCGSCFVSNSLDTKSVLLWTNEGSKYNGLLTNTILSIEAMNVETPEGYADFDFSSVERHDERDDLSRNPNIIIIMNESFTDITRYNDFYNDSFEDPIPYFHSLSSDTEHAYTGYAFSSVYGGGTSISEFEMLTGLTSAFLPNNVSPYVMYVKDDVYSIPWMLKENGYTTIAMHPYYSNGWNRLSAYPYMGFDEMYFIDDFEYSDESMMRGYMSDECAYENMIRVIEEHENSSDNPVFTFLITMQNHGGYDTNLETFEIQEFFSGYEQENVFATLMRKSDLALEGLLEYLSQQDEEYVVMLFGDHHPGIQSFNYDMDVSGLAPVIPYVIWDNKGIDYNFLVSQNAFEFSSVNYLGVMTLQAADIPLTSYFQMISELQLELPVINSFEYYSMQDEVYLPFESVNVDSDEGRAITQYRYLVYNSLFDNENNGFTWN